MELYILCVGITAIGWILLKLLFVVQAFRKASKQGNNPITRVFYGLTDRSVLVQGSLLAVDVAISSLLAVAVRLTVPGRIGGAIHLTMAVLISIGLFIEAKRSL
jgi:hypothetical protein